MLRAQPTLRSVVVPEGVQEIHAYLTYQCTLTCEDCTNNLVARKEPKALLSGRQWVEGLSRLEGPVPVVIRGGEPSQHPGFFEIMEHLSTRQPLRLITNLEFDVNELPGRVNPDRMNAEGSWAPIRATFHLGRTDPEIMLEKVLYLEEVGFRVGVMAMARPGEEQVLEDIQRWFLSWGTDFRIRPFVGYSDGKLVGNFRYPHATGQGEGAAGICRTSELHVGPDGRVYRCRHDCFGAAGATGQLLDSELTLSVRHRPCPNYGLCHPCDVEARPTCFKGSQRTAVEILEAD